MTNVSIHGPTGVLLVDGQKVFPIGLSDPPPHDALAPSGEHAFQELANGGATMIRTGTPDWALGRINQQIAAEKAMQDSAAAHGLHCWMRLGPVANLPGAAANKQLLQKVVDGLQGPPGALRLQGRRRAAQPVPRREVDPPGGLVRAHTRIKALDPKHPLVIIQAPRSPVSQLVPYRPAFDITGVDIFPIAYPPGLHCDNGNTDISVVGDMAAQDEGGERRQAGLDDAADRLERHRAVQGDARPRAALPVAPAGALHGLPGDRERRARPRLLRRPPDRGLHARRRQGGLELDVLAAGAAARSSTS